MQDRNILKLPERNGLDGEDTKLNTRMTTPET